MWKHVKQGGHLAGGVVTNLSGVCALCDITNGLISPEVCVLANTF